MAGTDERGIGTPNGPGASLARTLRRLRRRMRLSQRTLARQSGIAFTTIQGIEDEKRGVNPSPHTLRALAAGLARDEETKQVDRARANRAYESLMAAAGHLDGIVRGVGGDRASGLIEWLRANMPPDELAAVDAAIPHLDDEAREFLLRSIAAAFAYVSRQAERGRDPDDPEVEPEADPPRSARRTPDMQLQHRELNDALLAL